jgi:hypothetical protein
MRETGGITSDSFNGTYTTINAANNLTVNEVVMIGSVDYIVTERTDLMFKVRGDATGEDSYKALAPYYEYGHILEIAKTLMKKDEGTLVHQFKKYPIIILPLDITGVYNSTFDAFDYDNITLIIANITDPTFTAARRLELSFKPTLYPLYEELMTKLRFNHNIIPNAVVPYIEHSKTDRFFWGSQLNPQGNVVNDHLDAIEIKDMKIKVKNINC